VDVRFISASNKNLEGEVIEKRFREDLYFRLNVIQISMPPLRERDGDLPILSQYFLEKYSHELGKDVKKISAYAMDILSQYPFPGNVRELENIIERSVALESSSIVLPESLTLSHFEKYGRKTEDRLETDLLAEGIKLDEVISRVEKDYIQKALEISHWSIQKTAELLGVTSDSLKYRMKKLNIKS
jgi:two-component system response regulator PilR (NtrC family)